MKRKVEYSVADVIDDMKIVNFTYNKHRQRQAVCECVKCGRIKNLVESSLTNHKGTSHRACGQYLKTKEPKFYRAWLGLKDRIYDKNGVHYHLYGGRGLETDYDNFIDFYDDEFENYKKALTELGEDISLDRVNNDLGYLKGNLRWTTQIHQVRNSSKIRLFYAISPSGDIYKSNNQTQFSLTHGISNKQVACVLNGRFKSTLGWKFIYAEEFHLKDEDIDKVIEEMYY